MRSILTTFNHLATRSHTRLIRADNARFSLAIHNCFPPICKIPLISTCLFLEPSFTSHDRLYAIHTLKSIPRFTECKEVSYTNQIKHASPTLNPFLFQTRTYITEVSSGNADCKCRGRIVIPDMIKRKSYAQHPSIDNKTNDTNSKFKATNDEINENHSKKSGNEEKQKQDQSQIPNMGSMSSGSLMSLQYTDRDAWESLKTCTKYIWVRKPIRKRVYISILLLFLSKLLNIQVPIYFKDIIDSLTVSGDAIMIVPLAMIIGYAIARSTASLFHELRSVMFSPVTQEAVRQVSIDSFFKLLSMDLSWHLSRQMGALTRAIDRGTRAIHQILTSILLIIVPTFIEIIFVAAILGTKFGFFYAVLTMSMVSIYTLITYWMTKWRTRFRVEMNHLDSLAASVSLDSIVNYETVKYFNNEKLEVGRYEKVLRQYDVALQKTTNSLALLNWCQNLVFSSALGAGMLMAAHGTASGMMTLGDMVMINALLLQLSFPLNFLGSTYRETRQALTDMSAMFKFMKHEPTICDYPDANPLDLTKNGEISFHNVKFSYSPDTPIISDLNFTIPENKKVAIIGMSGCGKTTLLRLLYRLYDPDQGSVLIGGQNIKNVTLRSLREIIGIVPQDLVLFNDTIFYNIQYGCPDAAQDLVEDVCKQANIHEAIMRMPEGYQTQVGERGLKLSGGEKQRICLARALLKNPRILVLDEATSALDSASEEAVQKAIDNVLKLGRTVLIISHRLKTVYNADKILILQSGKIVEQGTHRELVANNKYYANLLKKQNFGES